MGNRLTRDSYKKQTKINKISDQPNQSGVMFKRNSQFDKRKVSINNSRLDSSQINISAFSTQLNESTNNPQQMKQKMFQSRNSVGSYMTAGFNQINDTKSSFYRPGTTHLQKKPSEYSQSQNERQNSRSISRNTINIRQNQNESFKTKLQEMLNDQQNHQRRNIVINNSNTHSNMQDNLVSRLQSKLRKRKIKSSLKQRESAASPGKNLKLNDQLNRTFTNFNSSNKKNLLQSFSRNIYQQQQNNSFVKSGLNPNQTVNYSQNFSQTLLNESKYSPKNMTASLTPKYLENFTIPKNDIQSQISVLTENQNKLVGDQFNKLTFMSTNYSKFFNSYKGAESPKKQFKGLMTGRNFGTGNVLSIGDLNEDSYNGEIEYQERTKGDEIVIDPIDYQSFKGVDCAELITKAQNEIKVLQYKATNLICGDDLHINLDKNDKKIMEILPGTTQYLKIHIQGKVPPCKLLLEFPDDKASKKNDLKFFLSRRNKQPSQNNCEKQFHKVASVQLDSVDPFYLQQFLYVAVYSDSGCNFVLKILFPKDDQRDKNPPPKETNDISMFLTGDTQKGVKSNLQSKFKALIQRKVRDLSDDRGQHTDFFDYIDQLKKKRNQSVQRGVDVNLIAKNKEIVNMWNYTQLEQLKSKIDDNEDRIQKALQRKRDSDMQNYKKKVFLLNKWQILKIKRNEFNCFNFLGSVKFDHNTGRSQNILKTFLEETSSSFELIRVFNRFYSRMLLIQSFFKEQQMLDVFRIDLLRKAWDIQRDIMSRACMKATGKAIKAKLKKLSLLTDSIREEFVKLYFQRSKLLFIIKFIELHTNEGIDPRIEKYISILRKLEKKLGLKASEKEIQSISQNQGKSAKSKDQAKSSKQPQLKQAISSLPQQQKGDVQQIAPQNKLKSIQSVALHMKKIKTKEPKIIDGIGSLSLFFSFAPQPEQIRVMIDKAISKQEKSLHKNKSQNKAEKSDILKPQQQIQDGQEPSINVVVGDNSALQI